MYSVHIHVLYIGIGTRGALGALPPPPPPPNVCEREHSRQASLSNVALHASENRIRSCHCAPLAYRLRG